MTGEAAVDTALSDATSWGYHPLLNPSVATQLGGLSAGVGVVSSWAYGMRPLQLGVEQLPPLERVVWLHGIELYHWAFHYSVIICIREKMRKRWPSLRSFCYNLLLSCVPCRLLSWWAATGRCRQRNWQHQDGLNLSMDVPSHPQLTHIFLELTIHVLIMLSSTSLSQRM